MNTNIKAIILAAGRGSRLYPITIDRPKCLLEIGGERIIDRQIDSMRMAGIKDIVVVVGYKGDVIRHEVGDKIRFREYHDYDTTNNLHTLWSVRDELNDGFICLFSDVVFDTEVMDRAKKSKEDFCLIIDTGKILEGTMRVKIRGGRVIGVGSQIPISEASGNFIGIAKFSENGAKMLLEQMGKMVHGHRGDYYTIAVDTLARRGILVGYIDVRDSAWIEIDTKKDLDKAEEKQFVGAL